MKDGRRNQRGRVRIERTAPSGLEAAVKSWLWRADIAHKKLGPADVEAMRQLKAKIQLSLHRLQGVLSKVADHSGAEEVERCVAQFLDAVSWISQLSPIPTPNVRKTTEAEQERELKEEKRLMRLAKSQKPLAIAINQAYEAEFAKRRTDWEASPFVAAGHAAKAINADLQRQGFESDLKQITVYKRFRKLEKASG